MRSIFCYILIVSTLLLACGDQRDQSAGVEKADAADTTNVNPALAELTAAQIRSIGISFGSIEQKQLTSSLKTNGVLRVPNQNKASINTLYSGVIRSLLVQPGNLVKKGQVVATIANPQFIEVQSQLINTNSRIVLAELEVKRQKELNAGNAGALKNLQSAESELRSLRTTQSTLAQQVRLMGLNPATLNNGRLVSVLSITSPINGVVSDVMVKMGTYVDVTTPVAEIVDNSSLHLDLFVYEKDLSKLKNNQAIHFNITNNAVKEYDAKIFSLGSSFEGDSKAVSVHAMVEGDKTGLIDGMNVTAVISLDKATVPAVPTDAIVNYQGQDYMFVLIDSIGSYKFQRVAVAKGGSDVGFTEVTPLNALPGDAKVVVTGAFFVLAKMTNKED